MLQVYNYMLDSFPVKREVAYPAHKRSELRKVYKDIVNLSKNAPLYKIDLSRDNKKYAIDVKEAAMALKVKISDIQDPEFSGFKDRTVDVSDFRVVSAKLLKGEIENFPEEVTLKVNQLASVQVNLGRELLHTSRGLPTGEYHFRARVSDNVYDMTFVQSERTENKDTLKAMAEFLNLNIPELNASVEQGASPDYSRIMISADPSGRFGEKLFVFEELDSFNGSVVEFFGLNRMDRPSTLAQFQLNEVDKSTATNTFTLENTLKITLNRSAATPVTLRIVPDSEKILSAVDSVLNTYNGLMQIARNRTESNTEHYKAAKLLGEMKRLEDVYKEELEAVGFIIQEDGSLKLDEALAVQAAKDGGMENLFSRENGFIAKLSDKAQSITINPMEYLDKTIVTYPKNDRNSYRNPYVTSMYSGLLFSSYC